MKVRDRTRVLLRIAELFSQHADEPTELRALDNAIPIAFGRLYRVSGHLGSDIFRMARLDTIAPRGKTAGPRWAGEWAKQIEKQTRFGRDVLNWAKDVTLFSGTTNGGAAVRPIFMRRERIIRGAGVFGRTVQELLKIRHARQGCFDIGFHVPTPSGGDAEADAHRCHNATIGPAQRRRDPVQARRVRRAKGQIALRGHVGDLLCQAGKLEGLGLIMAKPPVGLTLLLRQSGKDRHWTDPVMERPRFADPTQLIGFMRSLDAVEPKTVPAYAPV